MNYKRKIKKPNFDDFNGLILLIQLIVIISLIMLCVFCLAPDVISSHIVSIGISVMCILLALVLIAAITDIAIFIIKVIKAKILIKEINKIYDQHIMTFYESINKMLDKYQPTNKSDKESAYEKDFSDDAVKNEGGKQ